MNILSCDVNITIILTPHDLGKIHVPPSKLQHKTWARYLHQNGSTRQMAPQDLGQIPLFDATFQKASRAGICQGTFEIVSKEVLWSVRGSHQTIWGPPLPNVTRHSGWWPHTVTPSIDRTLHQLLTITDLDLITEFDFLPNCARFP